MEKLTYEKYLELMRKALLNQMDYLDVNNDFAESQYRLSVYEDGLTCGIRVQYNNESQWYRLEFFENKLNDIKEVNEFVINTFTESVVCNARAIYESLVVRENRGVVQLSTSMKELTKYLGV